MPTKLLIVDDEPENIELLARRLTRRGFAIISATNAEDALKLAASDQPDLIVMDIKMPGVDGYEATSRLKANPDTAGIPVIVLTAHAMQEDRDYARSVGAEGYETKPVDLDRLLEKIALFTTRHP